MKSNFLVAAAVTALSGVAIPAWAGQNIRTALHAGGFSSPIYVTHAPGDFSRLFVVQQAGQIRIRSGGATLGTPFLTVTGIVSGGEQGLLGLAFHPDYNHPDPQRSGYFYVYYTSTAGGANTLARYRVSANPNVADAASRVVLFTQADPFSNHNGGWIDFGPDGYLYVAMGDGGSGNDPNNAGQNLTTLLGKMHRIDVDGADNIAGNDDDDGNPDPPGATGEYTNPADNPFVGLTNVCAGGANIGMTCTVAGDCPSSSCLPVRHEIWALGLRNPWRDSFDRLTGDLYIADVGQNAIEEINFQPGSSAGGENYGWRCMEGNNCTGLSGCTCNAPSLTDPIQTYNHGQGCSITGGYVYRGCAIPDLQGVYFYADYCSNTIWSLRYNGSTVSEFTVRTAELAPGGGLTIQDIVSFGEDAYGEIYIVDHAGEIFKILPDVSPVDCNFNGKGDACDILDGSSQDLNASGIPDECEIPPPPAPNADPSGISKSRAISMSVPAPATAGPSEQTALRVTLTSLHHPNPPYSGGPAANFTAFEGQVRWVGPPSSYVESSNDPTTFTAAVLQCEPHYQDWSTVGLVHAVGREVVPSSTYTVVSMDDFCAGNEDTCMIVSSGLQIVTGRWADIVAEFNPPSASVQPDVSDVSSLVDKFRSTPGAPSKSRAVIAGETPDFVPDLSFENISACVDAFRGVPYPQRGPESCP